MRLPRKSFHGNFLPVSLLAELASRPLHSEEPQWSLQAAALQAHTNAVPCLMLLLCAHGSADLTRQRGKWEDAAIKLHLVTFVVCRVYRIVVIWIC